MFPYTHADNKVMTLTTRAIKQTQVLVIGKHLATKVNKRAATLFPSRGENYPWKCKHPEHQRERCSWEKEDAKYYVWQLMQGTGKLL